MNELVTQIYQIYGYLHGMWRYRWSALAVAWIVALAGWGVVFSIPNQYSAKAVVYADTSSMLKPLLKGLTPETDAKDELNVMKQVLLSRENLLSVIRETDLDLKVNTQVERERLLTSLGNSIHVNKQRGRGNNNVYEIGYSATSAKLVYQVVSNLLNTMIEDTLNTTRTDTSTAQQFIDKQIAGYEQRLTIAEQKLAEFKKANVGYMPDEKGTYYTRLQDAQDKVRKTRSELNLAMQRHNELTKQLKGESPLLDSASYQSAYIKKLQLYENQLARLLEQYTVEHPDVVALKDNIAELKANKSNGQVISESDNQTPAEFNPVYQEMKVQMSQAGVEIQILKTQLAEQVQEVQKLKESIDIIPEVEAQLAKLNRDYEITKQRYRALVERRESANLAQNVGQSISDVNFRVIDPPVIPIQPSGPRRMLLLAGVLLLALAMALVWSFARYMLQPTFIDINQVRDKTGLPTLGAVGLYLSPEHKIQRRIQLASFVLVACLLVLVCAGVLIFNHEGTELVKKLISG
jgi:polysaccharide chain length determinant protein (PEP-CTERM system associated)